MPAPYTFTDKTTGQTIEAAYVNDLQDAVAELGDTVIAHDARLDTLEAGGGGGGAVASVNAQTGAVVLDADDIDDTSTTNKFATAAELTKLAGIEAAADVTDATNVDAAGAVMNSDTSTAAMSFVIDEDSMATNTATKVPTQQSVKAYVDAAVIGGGGGATTLDGLTDVAITSAAQHDVLAQNGTTFVNRPDMVFNILDYGAVGNGIFNNDTAFANAIAAAKVAGNASNGTGAVVYVPPGAFSIRNPIVLPRTGTTPMNNVWLVGESITSSQIIGHTSFPTNRALIEWDTTTARTYLGRIERLTLACPSVANTMAIWWNRVNTGILHNDYHPERAQIDLRDIDILASNQYQEVCIRIEGGIWFSCWENVSCEITTGTWAYDTLGVRFDYQIDLSEDMSGSANEPGWTTDVPGFSYGTIRNFRTGGRRGGKSRAIEGRLLRSIVENVFPNGGQDAASINYNLINCVGNYFSQLGSEGLTEGAQIQLTNGRFNMFQSVNLGTPDATQVGIKLINSTDNIFRDRLAFSSQPAFSTVGSSKAVTLDAASKRNRFENFGLSVDTGGAAGEITDSGTDNYFWGIADGDAAGGGTKYTIGTDPYASGGGGAVDSVNGATGDVVLDADDISDSGTTHKWFSDPRTTLDLWDDFTSGNANSSGQIGVLGWQKFQGTLAGIAGEANHPGILNLSTGSTITTVVGLGLGTSINSLQSFLASMFWDVTFIIRPGTITQTTLRAGMSSNGASQTPTDAVYFEKLHADTNWTRVTRASSTQNKEDHGVAPTAATWTTLRVRRIDASTVGFSVDGGTEVTETVNVPGAVAVLPFLQIVNTEAVTKTVDIDYFRMVVTGLSR